MVIGHQTHPVMRDVVPDLGGLCDLRETLLRPLHFEKPAGGLETQQRDLLVRVFKLVEGKETSIRHAGPGILELQQAGDSGFEALAGRVQQRSQRSLTGGLPDHRAGGAQDPQALQVCLQRTDPCY